MHESVLVIHSKETDIEVLLEPFQENTDNPLYQAWEVMNDFTDLTEEELLDMLEDDGYCGIRIEDTSDLPDVSEIDTDCIYALNESGTVIFDAIKTNPNCKWDWYEVGGRWKGFILDKEGKPCNCVAKKDFRTFDFPGVVCNVLHNGKWKTFEHSWRYTEEQHKQWHDSVLSLIATLDDETMLTIVDFHY